MGESLVNLPRASAEDEDGIQRLRRLELEGRDDYIVGEAFIHGFDVG